MQELLQNQQTLISDFRRKPFIHRNLYNQIDTDHRLVGITGPRGVGKTTYLLHQVVENIEQEVESLYVSADNVYFLDNRLLDLVEQLYSETDIRLLYIDEIHKYSNWNQELKNIYDTYLEMKIIFTGSSMIDIVRSKYDLSRRVVLQPIYGLSFREYLQFAEQKTFDAISLDQLCSDHQSIAQKLNTTKIRKYFIDYLDFGYYPFFIELTNPASFRQAVENICQKIIYEDIATAKNLKTPTLILLEKLFKYVLSASAGELSVYKLASHLQKDFSSISEYLHILNEAGLIRFLFTNKSGKGALRNPNKMLPNNTNMLSAIITPNHDDNRRGLIRETFVLSQLQNASYQAYQPEKGDLVVDKYLFEIGGKNKTLEQIKGKKNAYVVADNISIGDKSRIPLFLFGFLY